MSKRRILWYKQAFITHLQVGYQFFTVVIIEYIHTSEFTDSPLMYFPISSGIFYDAASPKHGNTYDIEVDGFNAC
jgi:hypothetical protein